MHVPPTGAKGGTKRQHVQSVRYTVHTVSRPRCAVPHSPVSARQEPQDPITQGGEMSKLRGHDGVECLTVEQHSHIGVPLVQVEGRVAGQGYAVVCRSVCHSGRALWSFGRQGQ